MSLVLSYDIARSGCEKVSKTVAMGIWLTLLTVLVRRIVGVWDAATVRNVRRLPTI